MAKQGHYGGPGDIYGRLRMSVRFDNSRIIDGIDSRATRGIINARSSGVVGGWGWGDLAPFGYSLDVNSPRVGSKPTPRGMCR